MSEPQEDGQGDNGVLSFFGTILEPGSSLNPTFLLIVDAAFASLLLLLVSLAVATSGSIHFFFLICVELALWASVKWFIHELQKAKQEEAESKKDK